MIKNWDKTEKASTESLSKPVSCRAVDSLNKGTDFWYDLLGKVFLRIRLMHLLVIVYSYVIFILAVLVPHSCMFECSKS